MKIIAEVFKLPSGSPIPQFYGLRDDGSIDRAVTDTLLDLISESRPEELQKLDALLTLAQSGSYRPPNAELPDWSANDKNIWLTAPRANIGVIVVSNENIPELASGDGQPKQFSISEAKGAIHHWLQFLQKLSSSGAGNLIGQRFEASV
ncbi:hypothetical protein [Roseateles sp.]|uniref:hypothetical protein n=1 Tax=Roseateles sp. TaxID=1971397 RepID=UPI0031CE9836